MPIVLVYEMTDYKHMATHFLELVIANKIDEAYEKYVNMNGKHHNVYTPTGFDNLKKGMKENEARMPNKKFTIKNVICEGEMVAVYSHLKFKPDELGLSVVHIFRFKHNKIIEMWDCAQQIPKDSPNKDGAF